MISKNHTCCYDMAHFLSAIRSVWRGKGTPPIALIVVLLLLIPPHGILSANEENYFGLAERFVVGSAWPDKTAVFDASRHLMVSNATLGLLISAVGYTPAQVIMRFMAVAGYAVTLQALSRVFGLSALDAAVALMGMALIGQDIIGGEWLFSGYEAKVAAYVLVLAALKRVLVCGRLGVTAVLFAGATYLHFLVGGFWFVAAMGLRLLQKPRDLGRVGAAAALYAAAVMPLLGMIAWSRLADTGAAGATDVPSPDVIYSIIREPHHQSPFLSWSYFRERWLPGYLMAGPMLLTCLWVGWHNEREELRVLARWLAALLAYLFLILGPKLLDRHIGILGKFYLFRPSALILLLWFLLAVAVLLATLPHHVRILRGCLLALTGPLFLYVQANQFARTLTERETREYLKQPLFDTVKTIVPPGEAVLIDPDEETDLLDFERRSGLPTLVTWKFAPTNDAQIVLW